MNQGFKTYFGEGMQTSKRTLKKKGNRIKFYFLWLISFVGTITIIFQPVVSLVKTRLAYRANLSEDIYIFDAMRKSDSIKQNWTNLVFTFTKILLFLAGVLLISIFGGLAFGLGYFISEKPSDGFVLGLMLTIPFDIVLLIYIIAFFLYFAPSKYLLNYSQELTNSKIIYNSVNTMRKNAKMTTFMLNFVYSLIMLVILGVSVGIIVPLMTSKEYTLNVIGCVLLIVLTIVNLYLYPRFSLARQASLYRLFDDVCEVDFECKIKELENDNVKISRKRNSSDKKKFIASNKEQILVGLFKETKADLGKKNENLLETYADTSKLKVTQLSDVEEDINFDNVSDEKVQKLAEEDRKTYDNDFSDNAREAGFNFDEEMTKQEEQEQINANKLEIPAEILAQLNDNGESETINENLENAKLNQENSDGLIVTRLEETLSLDSQLPKTDEESKESNENNLVEKPKRRTKKTKDEFNDIIGGQEPQTMSKETKQVTKTLAKK